MPDKDECAYNVKTIKWKHACKHPVWKDGGPDEKHCLFHSNQYENKREAFRLAIDRIDDFLVTRKDGTVEYHFVEFKFPEGCSEFSGKNFDKDVNFTGAKFKGDALFNNAIFNGKASFPKAKFKSKADFTEATFGGRVNFGGTVFNGFAFFHDVEIIKESPSEPEEADIFFHGALIKRVLILKTRPKKGSLPACLNFTGTRVLGNLAILDSEIKQITADHLSYQGALTLRNIVFRNKDLENPTTLWNACLERARFINLDLSTVALGGAFIREVIFDQISFGKPDDDDWKQSSLWLGRPNEAIYEERLARKCTTNERKSKFGAAETVYRTLKHEMEKQHAKGLARRMRAGELECKFQGKPSKSQKLILLGYRFINGFGLRWIRAGLLWLALVLFFTPCYFFFGGAATYEEYSTITNRYETIKVEQIDIGYAFRHSFETAIVLLPQKHRMDSWLADFLEFFQRILCPTVFLLFLQAARNAARD